MRSRCQPWTALGEGNDPLSQAAAGGSSSGGCRETLCAVISMLAVLVALRCKVLV